MAKVTKAKLDKVWLGDVPEDKVFWCHNGRVVNNMAELADALKEMPNDIFEYHLNSEKNDFSSWVQGVLGDAALAADLQRATSRDSASEAVKGRLARIRDKR